MSVYCCICGKECKEIYYTVALSPDYPEHRTCSQCSDAIKKLDSTDYKTHQTAKAYLSSFFDNMNTTVKQYISACLNMVDENTLDRHYDPDEFLLTTGSFFEGYEVIRYHDVLFQESIILMDLKTGFKSAIDAIATTEYIALEERLQEAKKEIKRKVLMQASRLGANALLGIDFEASSVGAGMIMVSMSGTAVTIKPVSPVDAHSNPAQSGS